MVYAPMCSSISSLQTWSTPSPTSWEHGWLTACSQGPLPGYAYDWRQSSHSRSLLLPTDRLHPMTGQYRSLLRTTCPNSGQFWRAIQGPEFHSRLAEMFTVIACEPMQLLPLLSTAFFTLPQESILRSFTYKYPYTDFPEKCITLILRSIWMLCGPIDA